MKAPLTAEVLAELPQRLLDNAEAFFFAGLICSADFDGSRLFGQEYHHPGFAARDMLSGAEKRNYLGAPALANFAFSMELYLKYLIHMGGGKQLIKHDLCSLFEELEASAPQSAEKIVELHRHARGDRQVFLDEYLKPLAQQFQQWRYAHEHEFLGTSPDDSLMMLNALRGAAASLHPQIKSVFTPASLKPC